MHPDQHISSLNTVRRDASRPIYNALRSIITASRPIYTASRSIVHVFTDSFFLHSSKTTSVADD